MTALGVLEGRAARRPGLLRALSVVCVVMLLFCFFAIPAFAETPAEKYKRLKEELDATRALIKDYKNDLAAAQKLKAALEEEKRLIDEMVEVNQQEIARTEIELADKEAEIAINRQAIVENRDLLSQRLVAIYQMNNSNIISQIFSADSFSDLMFLLDSMQRISVHDTNLLKTLSDNQAALDAQQAEIDVLLADLQTYHAELLQNQADLAGNIKDTDDKITDAEAALRAQQQIEGDQAAALEAAQKEMQQIGGNVSGNGSQKGDGSEYVGGAFTWPVPGFYEISCHFGSPDPNGRPHRGMDIRGGGITGATIVACGGGTVITAAYADASYGNYVVIDHGDGVKTLYAHCQSVMVGVGQSVSQGEGIATVGSTGFVTGPHLHLEVHVGGVLQNPQAYLKG